jgi:hypothetical protein
VLLDNLYTYSTKSATGFKLMCRNHVFTHNGHPSRELGKHERKLEMNKNQTRLAVKDNPCRNSLTGFETAELDLMTWSMHFLLGPPGKRTAR